MNNNQNQTSGDLVSQGQSSNISNMFGQELHDLGDKIERMAEQLKSSGKSAEGDELYQLGNQVEHFFDKIKKAAGGASDLLNPVKNNEGKIGYLIAWLMGVPASVLLLIFLVRGH